MPYTQYPIEVEVLESLEFVQVRNLHALLRALDGLQFALQSQRTQGLALISNVVRESFLFSINDRFPAKDATGHTESLVCVDDNDWPFKFSQLSLALNYKVPDVSQTNKDLVSGATNYQSNFTNNSKDKNTASSKEDDATKCITSMSERDRFEKSSVAFSTGIADIRKQIKTSTLTLRSFEAKYNLVWKD